MFQPDGMNVDLAAAIKPHTFDEGFNVTALLGTLFVALIMVPGALREYAGLEKDVVLTGNLERIEIWDKAKWTENSSYDDMDSIELGLQDCGVLI